jgi:ribosomal protein S18 acetylase RimI-like enzyme
VAWVRVAAVVNGLPADSILDQLWADGQEAITELKIAQVNCMLLENWLAPHLERWGFQQFNDVVVLRREAQKTGTVKSQPLNELKIRPARPPDIDAMTLVDNAAFLAPWQYSKQVIQKAIAHSSCVTVAEQNGQVIGYQLSSGGWGGAHLARLAVLPQLQGRGIGRALVINMIEYFDRRGAPTITVNTQRDNASSLAVYKALGFELTGEHYEVWQWKPAYGPGITSFCPV